MLFGMGNADPDHCLLNERGLGQDHAAPAKIARDIERQRIPAGPEIGARQQRLGNPPVRAGGDARDQGGFSWEKRVKVNSQATGR